MDRVTLADPSTPEGRKTLTFRELMFHARLRPGMYIGGESARDLLFFLRGYRACHDGPNACEDTTAHAFFSDLFTAFVETRHLPEGAGRALDGVQLLVDVTGADLGHVLDEIDAFFRTVFPDNPDTPWRPTGWTSGMEAKLVDRNSVQEVFQP